MGRISQAGLNFIKRFEECRLKAYLDSVGVATIGWGHTNKVEIGHTCTQEQADGWLEQDSRWVESELNRLVTVPLLHCQFDALCSLVFNVGTGNFEHSTLLRKLNYKDYPGAAEEFPKWCKAGGKVLPGLVTRRLAERKLFESADMA